MLRRCATLSYFLVATLPFGCSATGPTLRGSSCQPACAALLQQQRCLLHPVSGSASAIGRWADRSRVSPRCPGPALDARRRSSSVCECACQRVRNEGQRSPDPSARKPGRKRADLRPAGVLLSSCTRLSWLYSRWRFQKLVEIQQVFKAPFARESIWTTPVFFGRSRCLCFRN
jgi:hypothetical protein